MEAFWNILKQGVRRREWKDLEELKEIIQQEGKAITMEEIRSRIAEMLERCKL